MAKRASKAKPVKVVLDPDGNPPSDNGVPASELSVKVAKLISRGEMSAAAAEVKASDLEEAELDAIMEAHPGLRDVCNRL